MSWVILRHSGEICRQSLELGYELGHSGEICRLVGSKFQTDGVMKLDERSPEDLRLHFGIFQSSLLEGWRVGDV